MSVPAATSLAAPIAPTKTTMMNVSSSSASEASPSPMTDTNAFKSDSSSNPLTTSSSNSTLASSASSTLEVPILPAPSSQAKAVSPLAEPFTPMKLLPSLDPSPPPP